MKLKVMVNPNLTNLLFSTSQPSLSKETIAEYDKLINSLIEYANKIDDCKDWRLAQVFIRQQTNSMQLLCDLLTQFNPQHFDFNICVSNPFTLNCIDYAKYTVKEYPIFILA